jgi:hypothetical protein
MPTKHEAITLALVAALSPHAARVMREQELPEYCPDEGLINVVPQDAEEEDQRLGTGVREFARVYELEVVVQDADETARAVALDAALAAAAGLLHGQLLGGLIDYLRLEAPQETEDVPMDGAASLKGAVLPVTVFYETPDNPMESD